MIKKQIDLGILRSSRAVAPNKSIGFCFGGNVPELERACPSTIDPEEEEFHG
jgi:hypothetical protein